MVLSMENDDPILIVDDSAAIRQTVKGALINKGYTNLHTASNGREALEKCRHKDFKVVFLDWSMPDVDGLTFLQAFRGELANKDAAVIMLTAMSDKKSILTALENGATDFAAKPVSIETMHKKMDKAKEWLASRENRRV
jgi:PleD family two-component response regulator